MPEDLQKSINDIVMHIKRGRVIPILGYDLLFNVLENKNNENDFLKLLIKKHAERDSKEFRDKVFEDEKNSTGYELINTYYHNLPDRGKQEIFKMDLSTTIEEGRVNWKLIPESFRKLVSIKHFKIFINGTFTNTLELAMNAYRAEGKNEEEIKGSYDVLNYHPIHPDDLPKSAPSRDFYMDFEKPIIYNLFGTHNQMQGEYLLTDADYIELIYDLIQDKNDKFKNLLSFFNKANVFFLGCNFPDWFFRFFIRVCVGNRLDALPAIERKTVIDSLNNMDSSRTVFIGHYKIQTLKIDCNTLIDEIYKALLKEKETHLLLKKANNNVFISYCRADEAVANDIAAQFDRKYIEYFLDKELRLGDKLDSTITDAIEKCCIFIPVISNNIRASSPYMWEEWMYAVSQKKKIWPVFKEFVTTTILIPKNYDNTDIKNIINKSVVGINLSNGEMDKQSNGDMDKQLDGDIVKQKEIGSRGHIISEKDLKQIKDEQFNCRISEGKRHK